MTGLDAATLSPDLIRSFTNDFFRSLSTRVDPWTHGSSQGIPTWGPWAGSIKSTTTGADVSPRSLTIVAIFIALVLLLELPVLSTSLPPMMDYPNHLARMRILAMGGDAYWQVHWGVLPNLAEDAFIWSSSGFLSVETAARVFLFLIVATNAIGVLLFGRAVHGDFRLWSLTGLMFIWSASLLWGFLNFSFGVGLRISWRRVVAASG